jgi:hypothetical protein
VALLLPLFFTYSGLNTKIGLLINGFLWLMCGAVLGKGVACWLAARATGISNREAPGIGVLMNARGLMELIIINIGLQRGIISEGLFATLVIMAVVTTLMASPIFDRLVGTGTDEPAEENHPSPASEAHPHDRPKRAARRPHQKPDWKQRHELSRKKTRPLPQARPFVKTIRVRLLLVLGLVLAVACLAVHRSLVGIGGA